MDIGLDMGFFAVKAVSGETERTFPSFVTRPSESLFSLNGHTTMIMASEHGRYLVGQEAIKKGVTGARNETATWIQSPEYMALLYGALSELTTATQARINLVTGLPLADYQRDRAALRDRLLGVHQFVREGRTGQSLKVESVRVVPQAWGAVLALLIDDRGKVVRPELMKSKVAVLDIGGHTVNYLSVDGLSDIPSETQGTERGAWTVVRAVRDYLDVSHPGLNRMRDHQVMQAIIDGETHEAGEPLDLRPIVKPLLNDIGQEIVDTAAQYWGAGAPTFRQVIVCGGGALLWSEHIKRAFRQAHVMPKPIYSNARGFANFAANLSHRG